jgi:hypothetical protein
MMRALTPTPLQLFESQLAAAEKDWREGEKLLPEIEALEAVFCTELRDARERALAYGELSAQQYRLATGHFRRGRRQKGLAKIARCNNFANQARQARQERRAWGRRLYELCRMRHVINVRKEHYFRLCEAARRLLPALDGRGLAVA